MPETTILTGALVVDGTGAEAVRTDVTVVGSQIADVGPADHGSGRVIDLDGLVLSPGFIDPHTHLDAQVLWDPDLTPSSWHGITSVVVGNCGFGIAPAGEDHRDILVRTLENVEGMSADALRAGISWDFATFPEYLDHVRGLDVRLNVASLVGHTPIRLAVLGHEASEREATESEILEMERLVAEAIAAGGVGFATSRSKNHQGAGGRPVPSRLASEDELHRLARASRAAGGRIVQLATGPGLKEPAELAQFADLVGSPVTWTALLADVGHTGESVQILRDARERNNELWAQIACRPIVTQTSMRSPTAFGMCPAFTEVLALAPEERHRLYLDETWRGRARAEADEQWGHRWAQITIAESDAHPDLVAGAQSVRTLADARGVHPLDIMLDTALDDDLSTRFRLVLLNDDEAEIQSLLHEDGALLALSDAGAHASQLCDAGYTTDLLGGWVRDRGAVSLEHAVWHLTGNPAARFGLTGRGRIAPGFAADLVAFDPTTVAAGPLERVFDLPAGADRLISRSSGIEHVWVGGTAIRTGGADTDARPGAVLTP